MHYFARPNQPLHVHLANVAMLAGKFGHAVGLHDEAVLAGSLHDLGKYRLEFQDYLRGDRASSQETQHAAYGAVWAIDNGQLLQAFVIAGHHAGLHDMADLQGIPHKPVLGLPLPFFDILNQEILLVERSNIGRFAEQSILPLRRKGFQAAASHPARGARIETG